MTRARLGLLRLLLVVSLATPAAVAAQERCAEGELSLLYFSRTGCPYCAALERDVLGPLRAAGVLAGRVRLVEVPIDSADQHLAERYRVRAAPTVLLVDGAGRELPGRRAGYNGSPYYGWYLERAIRSALRCDAHAPITAE